VDTGSYEKKKRVGGGQSNDVNEKKKATLCCATTCNENRGFSSAGRRYIKVQAAAAGTCKQRRYNSRPYHLDDKVQRAHVLCRQQDRLKRTVRIPEGTGNGHPQRHNLSGCKQHAYSPRLAVGAPLLLVASWERLGATAQTRRLELPDSAKSSGCLSPDWHALKRGWLQGCCTKCFKVQAGSRRRGHHYL
jgi:hypothetical protein